MSTAKARITEVTIAGVFQAKLGPRPVGDGAFTRIRERVLFAKNRIGKSYAGPVSIAQFSRFSEDFVKKMLRKDAAKWSFVQSLDVIEALRKCEYRRVESELAKQNDCSKQELRRRIADRIADQIARAKERLPNGEMRGGAIEAMTTDEWIEHRCDRVTMDALREAAFSLHFDQTIQVQRRSRKPIQGVAMLYHREYAWAVAAELVRVLESLDLLRGPEKTRAREATKKLGDFLSDGKTTPDKDGFSRPFHEACKWAFLSQLSYPALAQLRRHGTDVEEVLGFQQPSREISAPRLPNDHPPSRKGLP